MRIVVTGAHGFLGWHTRARLRALTDHEVVPAGRAEWGSLAQMIQGADAVLHLAAVNRGCEGQVERGNIELAAHVAECIRTTNAAPRLVYANSIRSGDGSPYGRGKGAACGALSDVAAEVGAHFVEVRLPHLFGEHGVPRYNSFVATFVDAVIKGEMPNVVDQEIDLLHAQRAADCLIGALETSKGRLSPEGSSIMVQAVLDKLQYFNDLYSRGEIPPLSNDMDIDLFNTLRAARFPVHYPISLMPHRDQRGSLVEVVRSHGGQGQSFVSTTRPGVTRGEHFHLRKFERFVVISGEARISLRRLFSDEVITFDVTGGRPMAVDMPTMWAHNISNTGGSDLTTIFWTNELFDPSCADTFSEPVAIPVQKAS